MSATTTAKTNSTTPASTDKDLAERLRSAITRMARRLRQQGDADASPTQLAILATIERRGPITLGELATIERVQPPTVTAAIDRLEGQDLVRRRADDTDRRVVRVAVTGAGRKLLARHRSRKTAYLAQRLDGLTRAERATLADAATILDGLLQQDQEVAR
ncbi:MAG: MarR family transcriptional regulator [Actinobacteria bacterium]|nr:MarR family transcriptional regulator [Actinomycetota bacterium]